MRVNSDWKHWIITSGRPFRLSDFKVENQKIKFKENELGIILKQKVTAATIVRRRAGDITDLISSSLRCHQSAMLQSMTFRKVLAIAIMAELAIGFPLHVSSDEQLINAMTPPNHLGFEHSPQFREGLTKKLI